MQGKSIFSSGGEILFGKGSDKMKITVKVPSAQPLKPDPYDPFGSYSGVPVVPEEKPVQDADDL